MDRIPSSQWAQVCQENGTIEYIKIPVPQAEPDELLVKIEYAGVCQNDLRLQKGGWPLKLQAGHVGGHEGTGTVILAGHLVTDIKVGDHVAIKPVHDSCGECEFSEQGNQHACQEVTLVGVNASGTFQQFCVCKAAQVVQLPRSMDLASAAPIMCAGLTAFKAIKESEAKPGEIVAIAGAGGGVGALACQYAKSRGCRVLAISHGAKERKLCLEELGVDYFVDYQASEDLVKDVLELTDGGPHAVIVASTSDTLLHSALQYVRKMGTVVPVGAPPGGRTAVNMFDVISRMVRIKGSGIGNAADTKEALEVFQEKKLKIPHRTMSLQDLPLVFEMLEKGDLLGRVVLKIPHQSPSELQNGFLQTFQAPRPGKWNTGTYLADRLEMLGVKHFFTVPGDYNLGLLDQLLKNPNLQMVNCCNELNAGYAADGYARVSPSGIAVVVVTHMVGSMSIINAVAGAYSEKLRVIVINGALKSGDYDSDKLLHHTLGKIDKEESLRIYKEVTCASVRLRPAPDIGEQIDIVLKQCIKKSLPVYIEIPMDVVQTVCPPPRVFETETIPVANGHYTIAAESFKQTFEAARNPVIIIGGMTRVFLSHDIISSFVSKLGCAVFCLPDGKSQIPDSHPQFCGVFWSKASSPEVVATVMGSDLWVVIGGRWSDLHTIGSIIDIGKEKSRIIDIQGDYIRMPDGNIIEGVFSEGLIEQAITLDISQKHASLKYFRSIKSTRADCEVAPTPDSQIRLKHVMTGIESILQRGDNLFADAGESWFNAVTMTLPDGVNYHMQMIYASIGWSLPAILGSQLAQTQGRSVLMIGDGAFQMTVQELSTLIRMRSNAIIFIFNNLGYRVETAIHDGPYNYIANWDYTGLVNTMYSKFHTPSPHNPYMSEMEKQDLLNPPVFSMRIETYGDLVQALNRTQMEDSKLAILECCIYPEDANPMLLRFGSALYSGKAPIGDSDHVTSEQTNGEHILKVPKPCSPSRPRLAPLSSSRLVISNGVNEPVNDNTDREDPPDSTTDHMLTCFWSASGGWGKPKISRSTSIVLPPTAPSLNYGIQCFEGMKVYRGYDGKLRLFRPELNCKRLLGSARRIGLPEFDVGALQELIETLVSIDGPKWLPKEDAGSFLYLRPVFIATDATLGVRTPSKAMLYVVCVKSPPFLHSKGMSLITNPEGVYRAWPGGSGNFKVGGNYAPTIPSFEEAATAGYSQILWLFGDDCRVTEAGVCNFFIVWETEDNRRELLTPPLGDGTILPGVTRQSVLDLAATKLAATGELNGEQLHVEERKITIHEIIKASEEGRLLEAFTTGTGYFICPVSKIHHRGHDIVLPFAYGKPATYAKRIKSLLEDIMYGRVESSWAKIINDELSVDDCSPVVMENGTH